ncbi:MAG: TIGR03986 family CRISPR-associated RAMP protein [Planctomycetales bacterium]|nr:TIGR03986 family CRISPR-associated RAMP protein [Planctomycetales bacterium]
MANGTLIVNAKRQVRVKWTNAKDKEVEMAVPEGELSAPLQKKLTEDEKTVTQLNGQQVELDEVSGQPKKVRPVGEAWQAPPVGAAASSRQGGQGKRQQQRRGSERRHGQGDGRGQPPSAHFTPAFHNPYNFISAPPRDHLPAGSELGDSLPTGHERFHADRFSGVISMKLTTVTPLLIPDAAAAIENSDGHKTFPVRLGLDGKPYLAPTSIKGMLRAAFEAVTNSRMGVSEEHDARLAYRMPAGDGLSLVPARIEDNHIVIYLGTTSGLPTWNKQATRWAIPGDLQYAAWLPRYKGARLQYREGGDPQHGDQVWCWLEKVQHWRWDQNARAHKPDFQYWKVVAISRSQTSLGTSPAPMNDPSPQDKQSYHKPLGQPQIHVSGYVCVTNQNIKNKHDERVFFVHGQQPIQYPLDPDLAGAWRELIDNYQAAHREQDIWGRRDGRRIVPPEEFLRPEPGKTAWSRHVYEKSAKTLDEHATCCYAFAEESGNAYVVKALYPVMISRKLHVASPFSLLSRTLGPAQGREHLSPADRVFGWINSDGHGAYRGNVRIGPVTCQTDNPVESFGNAGLPLAILGQPKPQQARFYVGSTPQGESQVDGLSRESAGYRQSKGLRGRKVYPHHTNLPLHYWDQPLEDRTQQSDDDHFQEYRRSHKPRKVQQGNRQVAVLNQDGTFELLSGDANEQRDDQNRSIRGWVKPTMEFRFDLNVANLSLVELGALIFLLTLPEDHFHRLGGGKPLGFGSVRLKTNGQPDLCDGAAWETYYSSLTDTAPRPFDVEGAINAFKQGVVTAYGQQTTGTDLDARFRQLPFIAAFLRACTGFADGLPVHYPRARQDGQGILVPPHPDGLAYEWFVANDRVAGGQCHGLSLPDLADDKGLPIL